MELPKFDFAIYIPCTGKDCNEFIEKYLQCKVIEKNNEKRITCPGTIVKPGISIYEDFIVIYAMGTFRDIKDKLDMKLINTFLDECNKLLKHVLGIVADIDENYDTYKQLYVKRCSEEIGELEPLPCELYNAYDIIYEKEPLWKVLISGDEWYCCKHAKRGKYNE